jgi:hypothetical protein
MPAPLRLKIDIFLCILLVLSSSVIVAVRGQTIEESRKYLLQLQPIPKPAGVLLWRHDPSAVSIIEKQLQAISVLKAARQRGDVTLLIPFLSYTPSPLEALVEGPPTTEEDVDRTKRLWPAFAVIVDNPFAANELKEYALDSQHSLNTRVAALIVLRYVDNELFKDLCKTMEVRMSNEEPRVRKFLTVVEEGEIRFKGIPHLESLPN